MENTQIPTPDQMNVILEQYPREENHDVYNPPEIMKHRQQTCFSCEFYNSTEMKCTECGCPVIMMSQFNFKKCPKGYWE
jgi:hypothetical protein